MKKSVTVPATFVASIAAFTIGGCSRSRECVDATGRRIPDAECRVASGRYVYPHYIYRNSSNRTGTTRTSGSSSFGSTSRGGFGGSSSGFHSFGG